MPQLTGNRVSSGSRWLARRPSPASAFRLFCVPYAGGNASIFAGWQAELGDLVEVCPIQLPGRSTRFAEPLLTRMEPLVTALGRELRPYLDRPFALFGHSMGALVAFELARTLRTAWGLQPAVLFISAWRTPEIDDGKREYAQRDPEFVETLRRYGATPPEILADPDALELLMPIVRADFEVAQTYCYREGPPVGCRIKAFSGIGDTSATPELMGPWSSHTTGSFSLSTLPGGHFFLDESRGTLLKIIQDELSRAQNDLEVVPARRG